MRIQSLTILLFLSSSLLIFGSCEEHNETHWIERRELQPSPKPNIQSLTLIDGKTIIFGQELGWYDYNGRFVEGMTLTGWHPAISLDSIDKVEIVDKVGSSTATKIGILLLIFLGLGLILGIIELTSTANSSGCVVILGFIMIGATIGIILFV